MKKYTRKLLSMSKTPGSNTFIRFSKQSLIVTAVISIVYFIWTYFLIGLRSDHIFILIFSLLAYYAHPISRKVILAFSIFLLYWIIYDSLRIVHNYELSPVSIKELYNLEKGLFGINYQGILITPNEYFAINHTSFLDLLAGLFYINWIPIPFFFAFYFLFKLKNTQLFIRFSYAFVFTNIIGFILYYVYPAAPPWYVDLYGFEFIKDTYGSTAGLSRFDDLIGMQLFSGMYEKNSNVFAAMPSLHSAYPVVLLYYGSKLKRPLLTIFFVIFVLGIWFAAVYTNHHYIMDVIAGAICAIIGIVIFEQFLKIPKIKECLNILGRQIQ